MIKKTFRWSLSPWIRTGTRQSVWPSTCRRLTPTFYGIYVPEADQESMKAGYGVYAEKNYEAASQSAVDYLVDHTGWIYVIDKSGDLRLAFSHTTPADEIIADVEQLLKERS